MKILGWYSLILSLFSLFAILNVKMSWPKRITGLILWVPIIFFIVLVLRMI